MMNPARGRRGIAVAPHSLASQSALAILREGGNAVEAMVAAAATIAVVYPHMNSIGGDSFWLLSLANGGAGSRAFVGVEGCGAAAAAATRDRYAGVAAIPFRGPDAALTVAGTISAWERSLAISRERLGGRLPLSRLLADAIDYARYGVPVTESQYRNTHGKLAGLAPVAGFAQTFLTADGHAPAIGSLFRQPRLAATLDHLARAGLADFYTGELAQRIAADLQQAGSPLALDDLRRHRAEDRTPLALAHSLGTVYNMPPPTQGLVSLMILGLMDRLDASRTDHLGADYVHAAVESVKRAFGTRDAHLTDPAHMRVDPVSFLEPAALDAMAATIDMQQAAPWGEGKGPADTVWLGVVDADGNAVSMIQSIYHEFGSGIVLPQSGITWQNRGASFSLRADHINTLEPLKKPFHTLNPALAELRDGRLVVYGNMGGDGQPQSQSAVFTRTAVHGLNPQDAVNAPRWLLGRTWGQSSDTLKLESRFPAETVEELRRRGHTVELLGAYDEACGHAGCLIRHPDGSLEGGFDLRSDGGVAAF
ncbi:gamma-glutamyltransferase family protein [Paraburkholderia caballeronis]|uniref:gamma-glutamyltransferase family protein n=1 Tax=Paraburkholderia caballeronis TaxID=416943 RepID=UPI0010E58308|nr:gamma-glutamyltransferase [Paraburkholderia caballeronis]TDV05481.1 gamma-glutamyltransferase 2 [Paraburkholderia caballeronis]TDV09108.1 gamma-glutamyltransferase 2 [Paraburkholderia caballeronis]TDV20228.1 gamma-glutamyltransferase 2 [Paraburkholderia caballeronis]